MGKHLAGMHHGQGRNKVSGTNNGSPPTQGQPPTYTTTAVATGIVQGITQDHQPQRVAEQTLQEATQKSEKGQRYDEYRVLALQGWYGTEGIPQIWSQFEATKKVDTHCLNIELDMQVWAGRQGIILDRGVVLAKGNIDDITGLHPNPGNCTAIHKSAECGVSVLACRPRTIGGIKSLHMVEKAREETELTRTEVDTLHQKNAGPRPPTNTYEELKANVTMFCALLNTLFGPKCDYYLKV
jgi:hypothetical protein